MIRCYIQDFSGTLYADEIDVTDSVYAKLSLKLDRLNDLSDALLNQNDMDMLCELKRQIDIARKEDKVILKNVPVEASSCTRGYVDLDVRIDDDALASASEQVRILVKDIDELYGKFFKD